MRLRFLTLFALLALPAHATTYSRSDLDSWANAAVFPNHIGAVTPEALNPLLRGIIDNTCGIVSSGDCVLPPIAANSILGNATGSSASPSAVSVPSCSAATSALGWTAGTGFACNSAINAATLGGATFVSPGAIGSTTPGTGKFSTLTDTALSSSGMVTNTSGGALGTVAYAVAADVRTGTDAVKPLTASALSGSQAYQTLTYGSTTAWNMASGYNASVTMTGNISTLTISNPTIGQTYILLLVQDATGSRTVTWPASVDWGAAGAPVLTTTANKTDMVTLVCLNTSGPVFYASAAKGF